MTTLRQLEFVVAVAEEGSFTAAAARCHIVQSALSHQIAKLEDGLGARLFDRRGRTLRITPAGEVFLRNARLTLRAAQRLHEEMAEALGTVAGRINIGHISSLNTVSVPSLLRDYRKAHAGVDVHLRTGMSEALLADLADGRLDIALVGVGPQVPLPDECLLLGEEPLALLVAPDHSFARRRRIALAELDDVPMAGLVAGAGTRSIIDDAFAEAGLRQRLQYEVTHVDLVRQLVAAGLGVSILPRTIAEGLREVAVVELDPPFRFFTYACWSRDPTPAARAFMALLRERHRR